MIVDQDLPGHGHETWPPVTSGQQQGHTGDIAVIFAGLVAAPGVNFINHSRIEAGSLNGLGSLEYEMVTVDLETGEVTALDSHGRRVYEVAIDATGRFVVTADRDGVIRVGPITGEEPHLLFGHENSVTALAVDLRARSRLQARVDPTAAVSPDRATETPNWSLISVLDALR